ncbi:MAG: hypothetical protein WC757_00965 [Candidatus Paceibacterota bacterium]|jgi:hypothetical protein
MASENLHGRKIFNHAGSIAASSFFLFIALGALAVCAFFAESVFEQIKAKAATASASPLVKFKTDSGKKPQFILLGFDGSRSLDAWEKILDFSQEMKGIGTHVNFTFFISGVYLLDEQNKDIYKDPLGSIGRSLIGFGRSDDIAPRVSFINRAITDGHEIGSHANGHFSGHRWTFEQWMQEFTSFNFLIDAIKTNNSNLVLRESLRVSSGDIIGFRAPELATNVNMYHALASSSFVYDASGISQKTDWPKRDKFGIWHIPLSTIFLNPGRIPTITMDYSVFMTQTDAQDTVLKDSPEWMRLYEQLSGAYRELFDGVYDGGREPIAIGHHFSEWNSGVYWEVMKDFIREECGKPEVNCVTYKELVGYMEAQEKSLVSL